MSSLDAAIVGAHAHSWSGAFAEDHDEVIKRAWGSGLSAVAEVGGSAHDQLGPAGGASRRGRLTTP